MSEFVTFIFYMVVIIVAAFISKTAYMKRNHKYKKILILFSILMLAIVAGIRFEVGSDWLQYYRAPELFDVEGIRGTKGDYELGYRCIAFLVRFFNLDGSFFLFLYAFITYFFLFRVFDKFASKINIFATVFMYGCLYYLVSFNITRQALSISIAMYAITLSSVNIVREDGSNKSLLGLIKQNTKFLIWVAIAFLFHKGSAICVLALPICYFMRKKNTIRIGMLIVSVLAVMNFKLFMQLAIKIMGSYDFQWYFIAGLGGDGSWLKFILRYLPFLIVIWLSYKNLSKDHKMFDLYNLTLIGLIINSLSLVVATDIERVGFPFLYFLVIVTGYAMKTVNYSGSIAGVRLRIPVWFYKLFNLFLYLFMIWTMWYIFFAQRSYGVVPYQTIFSK